MCYSELIGARIGFIRSLSFAGFDGTGNEWDEYSQYVNPDGVDMTSVSLSFFQVVIILVVISCYIFREFLINLYCVVREFMGTMDLLCIIMVLAMHRMDHIHLQLPQFQLWEMMVSCMGHNTTTILPTSSRYLRPVAFSVQTLLPHPKGSFQPLLLQIKSHCLLKQLMQIPMELLMGAL